MHFMHTFPPHAQTSMTSSLIAHAKMSLERKGSPNTTVASKGRGGEAPTLALTSFEHESDRLFDAVRTCSLAVRTSL